MHTKAQLFFFAIISFFTSLTILSSCSKKDESPKQNTTTPDILGKWTLEKIHTLKYENGTLVADNTIEYKTGEATWEFTREGAVGATDGNGKILKTGTKINADRARLWYTYLSTIKIMRIEGELDSDYKTFDVYTSTFDIKELTDRKLQIYYETPEGSREEDVRLTYQFSRQ